MLCWPQLLWGAMQSGRGAKRPVGLVLMSQELVAGIGNIYRAEILFKARPMFTVTSVTQP